jgi:predicted nucleotidyltransferase
MTFIDPVKIKEILSHLHLIELEKDVKILFAIESGSRAWGFSSPNSDYDIRFVYKRKRADYLSLSYSRKHEVIEQMGPGDLDFSGWDIRKALQLALHSNPSLCEWVHSPICYIGHDFRERLKQLVNENYSLDTLVRAYHSMAKGNYIKYIKDRDPVSYKRYLYVLRPLLIENWMLSYSRIAPIEFAKVRSYGFPFLNNEIDELLRLKTSGEEIGEGPRMFAIDAFIQASMNNPPGPKPLFGENVADIGAYESFMFEHLA